MDYKWILNQIGMKIDTINKYIKQNKLNIDLERINEVELFKIVSKILEDNRNKMMSMKQDIITQKEEIKRKWQELEEYKNKTTEEEINKQRKEKEIELNQEFDKKRIKFDIELLKEKEQVFQEEREKFKKEIEKLSKKQIELENKEKELLQKEELLNQQLKTFEATKNEELNKLKEKLKLQEDEFLHNLKEKEVKKLEEINQKIKELYQNKEDELKNFEEDLNQTDIELKAKEKELNIKEKELINQENQIEVKVNEQIEEKIKSYESKIERLEEEIEILRDERDDLLDEVNSLQRNQDKDIIKELENKRDELKENKEYYEKIIEEKNKEIEVKENLLQELKQKNQELLNENEALRVEIEEIERIKSQNRILEEKLKDLKLIEAQNNDLRQKLEAIYSTGKEKELRIKDIQKEPLYKKRLELEQNITDEVKWLEDIQENMKKYGVNYPKRLLLAFHTALKSNSFSPLTVLAGVSGTGKSELPKLYAHFGGFNFLAEAVQPNWDSPESMMGYYNTIENKFDATNILKFLVQTSLSKDEYEFGYKESMNMILLDEMNLAHIELYFAEFLSKFEQKRGSKDVFINIKLGAGQIYDILLDNNLLWIGTMNEDETTKSLSDKVLDRSFVINFPRPTKLLSRNKLVKLDEVDDFKYLKREIWDSWIQKESIFKTNDQKEIINKYKNIANEINKILSKTGRAIGHRVWQSMEFYINNHPEVLSNQNNLDSLEKYTKLAFEEQLVQKIMPKFRGIETHGEEKKVLESIKDLLSNENFKITQDFEIAMSNPYGQFVWSSAEYLKED